MNLPNFFLADLPTEATVNPSMLEEACRALKHNREHWIAGRSTASMIDLLCHIGAGWLDPEYPLRRLALEQGPKSTGFGTVTLQEGIESFFSQFTVRQFEHLLEQDLGHLGRLDRFSATPVEEKGGRSSMAIGPEFLVHITAGNLPNPTWMSISLGLLLRSAQFVKCARGASFLPRLFAHSIYEADPKVGACLEIAEWPGGSSQLESILFEEADCITATGSDETLVAIRAQVPPRTRFVAHGQMLSFAFVSAEALSGVRALQVVQKAAADVAAWDQLGCLSPHVIYVEQGGATSPEQFSELLARQLQQREALCPRGELPVQEAAAITSRRSIYDLRSANSTGTRCWSSPGSTAWTVVYEEDPRFQMSCLNRFIYVKATPDLKTALQGADWVRKNISTVALAAAGHQRAALAAELARWGARRICAVGQMQHPSLLWRHDGNLSLGELVNWADWEEEP